MKTLNSISGGRTSAYMAAHFHADFNVFVAVCSDNKLAQPKDLGLLSEIRRKLCAFDAEFGEFIGSPEDALTFKVVLDLEQMIGSEIVWLRGESFEALVKRKSLLPNTEWRVCTTETKMQPIARFIYEKTGGGKVLNRVGIRIDEAQRIKAEGYRTQTIKLRFPKGENGRHKHLNYEFAEASYPLVFDDEGNLRVVRKSEIYQWASQSGLIFPDSSNCQWCFHKNTLELLGNQQRNPDIIEAGAQMEAAFSAKKGKPCTMKKDLPLSSLATMQKPLQQFELFEGLGACESTYCTD